MEVVEAASAGLAQDPVDLCLETEARRRPLRRVHLELLCNRVDAISEHLEQRRVRRLYRQHRTWQQHDAMPSCHRPILFISVVPVVTPEEIGAIALFAGLDQAERERLCRAAADLSLVPGEYAAHEGGERALFAVLSGRIEAVKLVDGVERIVGERRP